jgi:NAD(P)-dependent dehydrogenase (short-subunit alcohol dehydrogenase family)
VAIVTGASSGIGQAIALAFAKEGADVCCVSKKNLDGLKYTTEEIQRMSRKSTWQQVDVAKISDIDKMVASTIDNFGRIDILVNNAGVYITSPILEVTEADWDTMLDVMLKGTFFCTQHVLPYMLKQGKGKIINIASTFGQVGFVNASAYCAAKGGVINLTRQLALELAPSKINVNAIGPATTATPLIRRDLDKPERMRVYIDRIPYGRVAQPEEIAMAAVYLASDESDFVNGHTLFVDGGWLTQ